MKVYIVCGGSGTRLWPLSTPTHPKQFLKVNNDKTLLQLTYDRAAELAGVDNVYVMPEKSLVQKVRQNLPQLSDEYIIVEPFKRGTYGCAIKIFDHAGKNFDQDEVVTILWADHLINNVPEFCSTFEKAAKIVQNQNRSVFVGLKPPYPSENYGYIECGKSVDNVNQVFELASFHEKPSAEVATKYVEAGNYFWNMGYLLTSVNVFRSELEMYCPDMKQEFEAYYNSKGEDVDYQKITDNALEYQFSEKIKDALVISGTFDWVDVGNFKDFKKVYPSDEHNNTLIGNNIKTAGVKNSLLINHTDTNMVVIDISDCVVVKSDEGMLVSSLEAVHTVNKV